MTHYLPALTYDDIQLIPQYSEIESRSTIDLTTSLSRRYKISVPYVASPMDTICEYNMAIRMHQLGGVGCIHRFMSVEGQAAQVRLVTSSVNDDTYPVMAAVGSNGDYLERAQALIDAGAKVLLIDVAHGHHKNVKDAINKIKSLPNSSHVDIIAGNIATYHAAQDLVSWGADGLRVGIGGGSLCSTRVQTGHGVPNITSIMDVVAGAEEEGIPVMADGGIRSSGDIAKALAVGADTVMLGSLLAGTSETPGAIVEKGPHLFKRYRGSASLETKSVHSQKLRNVEGESTIVPFKGKVQYVISKLNDGLQSALSYSGCNSISEFQSKADWIQVTNAGITEASPHLLG